MAFYRGPNVVTNGLVLCLDAANTLSYPGSGTTWSDLSGNNNTGSLINGPTFNSANGGSIVFDGTDDYVNLGLIPQLNGVQVNLTIDLWVMTSQIKTYSIIYSVYSNFSSPGLLNSMVRFDNNNITYYMSSNTANFQTITYLLNPIINNWYNIVVTVGGTTSAPVATIYVNGTSVKSQNMAAVYPNINTTIDFRLGSSVFTSAEVLNGRIATTKCYTRALSAAEVQQNYEATKTRFGL